MFSIFCILLFVPLLTSRRIKPEDFVGISGGKRQKNAKFVIDSLKKSHLFSSLPRRQIVVDTENPILYPTDFGADPTAKSDSTTAFSKVIDSLLLRERNNRTISNGIHDLGGAVIDLEGGDFVISTPILIPMYYGNFVIRSGTMRASSVFPKDRYLIEIGDQKCDNPQASCNENIGLENLMLDASRIATGCIHIAATMGSVIGPRNFFLGFTEGGVTVHGGHEVMISESWFGEYLYSDPRSHDLKYVNASAIQIFGNDHYVVDTIVFSSKVGVEVSHLPGYEWIGAANLFKGVHTWNMNSVHGGIGILMNTPGNTKNRVLNCYLDGNNVVAVSPQHLTISNSFFLASANIVLKALPLYTGISGLNIISNQFDGGANVSVMLDEKEASFETVVDTVVDKNMFTSGYVRKTTLVRRKSGYMKNTKSFKFDLSDILLFPDRIYNVEYSLELDDGIFARSASRKPNNNVVVIETDVEVSGTAYIRVDQSTPSKP